MSTRDIQDTIRSSRYWSDGESFRVADICGIARQSNSKRIYAALGDMLAAGEVVRVGSGYRRASNCRVWLSRAWRCRTNEQVGILPGWATV